MTTPLPTHDAIAEMISQLLDARAANASICPSEVARAVAPEHWRDLMPQVRVVAAQMAMAGALRITQGPETVEPRAVLAGQTRGPLRLRRELARISHIAIA